MTIAVICFALLPIAIQAGGPEGTREVWIQGHAGEGLIYCDCDGTGLLWCKAYVWDYRWCENFDPEDGYCFYTGEDGDYIYVEAEEVGGICGIFEATEEGSGFIALDKVVIDIILDSLCSE